jgi:outer membrane lipoprotein-sorting protein
MKHFNRLFFFVFLILFELACTSSGELDPNTRQQVKAMRAGMNTLSTKPVVMIYDFNQETFSLEYRAVAVENPTGNKIEDLVNTFLTTQHFGRTATNLRLKSINKVNQQTVLDFSGTVDFATSKDRSLFIDALEMTIARNTNLTNFLIKNI